MSEEDEALMREFRRDLEGVQNRISMMSGRARSLNLDSVMYALNRAWREIDDGAVVRDFSCSEETET